MVREQQIPPSQVDAWHCSAEVRTAYRLKDWYRSCLYNDHKSVVLIMMRLGMDRLVLKGEEILHYYICCFGDTIFFNRLTW
jgi:hypothetical protein